MSEGGEGYDEARQVTDMVRHGQVVWCFVMTRHVLWVAACLHPQISTSRWHLDVEREARGSIRGAEGPGAQSQAVWPRGQRRD
jgi:hypothetical protein